MPALIAASALPVASAGACARHQAASQETPMAKGQKRSNRETRKPKQEKAKPAVATSGSGGIDKHTWAAGAGPKGPSR